MIDLSGMFDHFRFARISDFRWHDSRHTFACWLLQEGVPLDRVSKRSGTRVWR